MKNTPTRPPWDWRCTSFLLRFSLSLFNLMLINFYTAPYYTKRFQQDTKTFLVLLNETCTPDNLFIFAGARYEDTQYQHHYLINANKYHNHYLMNENSACLHSNRTNKSVWDVREYNAFSKRGYIRHPQENIHFIYSLLNTTQNEAYRQFLPVDALCHENNQQCPAFEIENDISVLHLLSKAKGVALHLWSLEDDETLVTHPLQQEISAQSSLLKNTYWRFDLLLSNNTQLDLIEMVAYKKGIPAQDIPPFIIFGSYGGQISNLYIKSLLHLQVLALTFGFMACFPAVMMHVKPLLLHSSFPWRDTLLSYVLGVFLWGACEFQLHFDANLLLISQFLSEKTHTHVFCVPPFIFDEPHFFNRMSILAVLSAFSVFLCAAFIALSFKKENFLALFSLVSISAITYIGLQFCHIAQEISHECGYDFYTVLFYTLFSNFMISNKSSNKMLLLDGTLLKIVGQVLSFENFLYFCLGFDMIDFSKKIPTILSANRDSIFFFRENKNNMLAQIKEVETLNLKRTRLR